MHKLRGSGGGEADGHAQTVLVVDIANVMGSVPDGWWRDRLGAAERLIARLSGLDSFDVVAVVEGQARSAVGVDGVVVRAAPGSGDDEIVLAAEELVSSADVIVVTADRGLRARLPGGVSVEGPRWLLDQLIP